MSTTNCFQLILFTLVLMSSNLRSAETPLSFIADVAPILKENCFACHDSKKKSGKYDMTTFQRLMAGGEDGPAITAGKPEDSEAYTLIVTDESRRMPPRDKGAAVPQAKAEIIRRWIAEGAKLDVGLDPKADIVAEIRRRWVPPTPPKAYAKPIVVNAIAFTPDGQSIVAGGFHELTVWSIESGALQSRMAIRPERVYAMAFLKNGALAIAGGRPGQEGEVRLYNLAAKPKSVVDGVAMIDGVADDEARGVRLWDGDDCALCLAIDSTGTRLSAAGTDRIIRVWDVADAAKPTLTASIDNHADWVLGLAFEADGKRLFSAGRDRTAKVWDFAKSESILTVAEHQAIVYGVHPSSDGSLAFSVGADKYLRAWKPRADAKPIKSNAFHNDEVLKILPHPSKPALFTASADKVVRLWEATDKLALLKRFEGLKDTPFALAVSANGKHIAAGGYDGEIVIWITDDSSVARRFVAAPGIVSNPNPEK
jgi:hypothetical protein